jgi:hypothetical protein
VGLGCSILLGKLSLKCGAPLLGFGEGTRAAADLLPPRQSRGTSYGRLDQARQRNFPIRDVMVDAFRTQMLAGLI